MNRSLFPLSGVGSARGILPFFSFRGFPCRAVPGPVKGKGRSPNRREEEGNRKRGTTSKVLRSFRDMQGFADAFSKILRTSFLFPLSPLPLCPVCTSQFWMIVRNPV